MSIENRNYLLHRKIHKEDLRRWFLPEFTGQTRQQHAAAITWRTPRPASLKEGPTRQLAIVARVTDDVGKLSVKYQPTPEVAPSMIATDTQGCTNFPAAPIDIIAQVCTNKSPAPDTLTPRRDQVCSNMAPARPEAQRSGPVLTAAEDLAATAAHTQKSCATWKRLQRNESLAMTSNIKSLTTQGWSLGAPRERPEVDDDDIPKEPMPKRILMQVPSLETFLGKENLAKLRQDEDKDAPILRGLGSMDAEKNMTTEQIACGVVEEDTAKDEEVATSPGAAGTLTGAEERACQEQYECYWEREAALEEEIANAWSLHQKPSDLGDVASNLMGVMDSLHAWSGRTIGNVSKQINHKRKKLENLETRSDANSRKAARKVSKELDELLMKEETRWRQRSRISWLREGDRNTNYFHRRASWRQKNNKIEKLQSENGDIIEDATHLEIMTTDFFTELYKADPTVQPGTISQTLTGKIDDDKNKTLCADFTEEEISFALFQIGPTKAPGPDGFPACFFQRNWGKLKEDIIRAVQRFFSDGIMPDGINDTAIVLIPKIKNPLSLKDFRPISLCNVIYKVVAKCLVNRMRPLLNGIIAET
ncbi:hypothetical protein QYE76_004541 [Lolium multiflorum]|uniref:Reverse transcriptase n=1 Tax=Lolium multiflorum TaxID=4521 RepID=A0AAD8W2K6_LOLMU|nr:hypothetical protein QYE76_004541 [Lolium multiflorum]